jgi:hypothetical protein
VEKTKKTSMNQPHLCRPTLKFRLHHRAHQIQLTRRYWIDLLRHFPPSGQTGFADSGSEGDEESDSVVDNLGPEDGDGDVEEEAEEGYVPL